MNARRSISLATLALFATLAASPALAAPTTASCAAADTAMSAGLKLPASTGNLDRDFANVMLAYERAMMVKAKAEVACGTDAKGKSAAQAFLDDARERMKTMELIAHTN